VKVFFWCLEGGEDNVEGRPILTAEQIGNLLTRTNLFLPWLISSHQQLNKRLLLKQDAKNSENDSKVY
jgi:hypothetical protein